MSVTVDERTSDVRFMVYIGRPKGPVNNAEPVSAKVIVPLTGLPSTSGPERCPYLSHPESPLERKRAWSRNI